MMVLIITWFIFLNSTRMTTKVVYWLQSNVVAEGKLSSTVETRSLWGIGEMSSVEIDRFVVRNSNFVDYRNIGKDIFYFWVMTK